MARGLIEVIEPRLPDLASTNTPYMSAKIKEEHKWVKIYDMRDEIGMNLNAQVNPGPNCEIEVAGTKTNARYERKLDRYFMEAQAAATINRCVRYFGTYL